MGLKYSCREASRLLALREDEGLPLSSALKLRFHLLACTNCANFGDQMKKLTALMQELPASREPLSPSSSNTPSQK